MLYVQLLNYLVSRNQSIDALWDDITLLGVFYDPSAPPLNPPAEAAG
jgi:hypothetical protein